jgi:hypothetical protein
MANPPQTIVGRGLMGAPPDGTPDGYAPVASAAATEKVVWSAVAATGGGGCCEVLMFDVNTYNPAPSYPLENDGPGAPQTDWLYSEAGLA